MTKSFDKYDIQDPHRSLEVQNEMKKGLSNKTDEFWERRRIAYIDRWNEALRFINHGDILLDIGGGNYFPGLLDTIYSKPIEYYLHDLSASTILSWKNNPLLPRYNLSKSSFTEGFNDDIPYADSYFDVVFSSHCLEHSKNIYRTFSEIKRVLKGNGTLLMAVPLGWEINPAHPYFFSTNEWLSIVEDSGFRVRTYQVGSEYPESNGKWCDHDLFICAQSETDAQTKQRIDPRDYTKEGFTFIHKNDCRYSLERGEILETKDDLIFKNNWKFRLMLTEKRNEVILVYKKHKFSGFARILNNNNNFVFDCFSKMTEPSAKMIRFAGRDKIIHIETFGSGNYSFGDEFVFSGIMLKERRNQLTS